MAPFSADRDRRLHAAVDVYVPLHAACAGHERLAREAGNSIARADIDALASLLAAASREGRAAA
jgi:hypothetical protein